MTLAIFTVCGKQVLRDGEHYADAASTGFAAAIARIMERQELIEALLSEEGACVEFTGDNPDFNGLPNSCVTVAAGFTDWSEAAFRGDTPNDCLRDALRDRAEFEERTS